MSKIELDESRLGTTDETGKRIFPIPELVKGVWYKRRIILMWALILFYLILPWIYVDGKQWVLLDISRREFTLFGGLFYAHDGPLLVFIGLSLAFVIGFVTSVWGRVWCGWACPQTVFIEALFRPIEKFILGTSRTRKQLRDAPWTINKIIKLASLWSVFLVASLHIVHSFLGYFIGTRKLVMISLNPPQEHLTLFFTMLFLTALVLYDFGWFREQFCIIACPYGRFQSVLMDENSLLVGYDYKRGEPRREIGVVAPSQEGDCIDCHKCVKVCPTSIDIRRGTQLECIACTQCIDACDEIMTKLNRPTGLIRYSTENLLQQSSKARSPFKGARPYIYLGALVILLSFFGATISRRQGLSTQIVRGSAVAFNRISDTKVSNHFKLKYTNNSGRELKAEIRIALKEMTLQKPLQDSSENSSLLSSSLSSSLEDLFLLISPQFEDHHQEKLVMTFEMGRGEIDLFVQFNPKELALLDQEKSISLPLEIYELNEKKLLKKETLKIVVP
jgi:cytochrome c oxidase accessory protein FixG